MIVLNGKYNHARIMTDSVDEATQAQIINFLNHPAFSKSPIVIMSDCHAGKGAVIGFTMPLRDHVIPNVVGVDIGCGVYAYNIGKQTKIKFDKLDRFIKENIPSGRNVHDEWRENAASITDNYNNSDPLKLLCDKLGESHERTIQSLCTLGGGNHFIELDRDSNKNVWVVIHSGSRHFGYAIARYHQKKAKDLMIKTFHGASAYRELEFLPMDVGGKEYIEDAKIAQGFAHLNRRLMAMRIIEGYFKYKFSDISEYCHSVHNYIGTDNIIRKGAISAKEGEKVIIPLNMRDGSILGIGKGSKAWNYSAPHGAGRKYSRRRAKESLSLDHFKKTMKGIWTSSVNRHTLDEAPMAYKDKKHILSNLEETVEILDVMKPIYNFKAKD